MSDSLKPANSAQPTEEPVPKLLSTSPHLEHAREMVDLVYAAYDRLLELSTLLESFNDLERPPKWAFSLSRYAERATDAADRAHTAAIRYAARTVPNFSGLSPAARAQEEESVQ